VFFYTLLYKPFRIEKKTPEKKGHNSTVGGKVSVEKKNQANCKTGPNTQVSGKGVFLIPIVILVIEITVISEEKNLIGLLEK
jgi:hypothetical protein